jgi:hypothetical protein
VREPPVRRHAPDPGPVLARFREPQRSIGRSRDAVEPEPTARQRGDEYPHRAIGVQPLDPRPAAVVAVVCNPHRAARARDRVGHAAPTRRLACRVDAHDLRVAGDPDRAVGTRDDVEDEPVTVQEVLRGSARAQSRNPPVLVGHPHRAVAGQPDVPRQRVARQPIHGLARPGRRGRHAGSAMCQRGDGQQQRKRHEPPAERKEPSRGGACLAEARE